MQIFLIFTFNPCHADLETNKQTKQQHIFVYYGIIISLFGNFDCKNEPIFHMNRAIKFTRQAFKCQISFRLHWMNYDRFFTYMQF